MADTLPKNAILQKEVPFKRTQKIGENYNFPVKLQQAQGFTWNGGATTGTAFALNGSISMVTKNAQVQGSELVVRESISYGAISRSGEGNNESFGPILDEVPMDMKDSAALQQELDLLYGGTSIGAVSSIAGAPDFVLTTASWSAAIWSSLQGARIDAYTSNLVTKRNTVGPLIVGAVDPDTFTVTLSGDAGDLAAIQNGDVFVPRGAVGNWAAGLDKILTNTGTLFGIDAATYTLWKANVYDAGGAALTMNKVQSAVNLAVVRGLSEKVTVLVNPYSWTDINNDLAALRRFTESTKTEADLGTQKITFYGTCGEMDLMPHPLIKAGDAFCCPMKRLKRIGSTDITFRLPGMPEDKFFRQLENSAGVELRCYSDLGLIATMPARFTKITGIVNASLPT